MDRNYSKEFGEMILRKMQDLEITQVVLAKKVNIQQSTLSLYINGKRDMSVNDALRISNELKMGLEYYFEAGGHNYIMSEEEYKVIQALRSVDKEDKQKTMAAIQAILMLTKK